MSALFCFGLGYSADAIAKRLSAGKWSISGTSTSPQGAEILARNGYAAHVFDGTAASPSTRLPLQQATHVLVSISPDANGDPVLRHHGEDLASSPSIAWIGYLSTIGVYGDHQGAWVDEGTPAHPTSERSIRRLGAEIAWRDFAQRTGKSVQIFRLAGIYGPGRSAIENLRAGTARRISKPGQVFNRIHVDDIASALYSAMAGRGSFPLYNITDDEPAPPEDVVDFAARLLGLEPPPTISLDNANLSPMAASFYAENKSVRNTRMKSDLGVALYFPTYREGLRAIAAGG